MLYPCTNDIKIRSFGTVEPTWMNGYVLQDYLAVYQNKDYIELEYGASLSVQTDWETDTNPEQAGIDCDDEDDRKDDDEEEGTEVDYKDIAERN